MTDLLPPINSLFHGRSIFITGGTGFVGKVVIEKFLRDVPEINKVFVLVRGAKGKTAAQRWNHITQTEVLFKRICAECPSVLQKVVPVEGDISIDELGLSEQNLKAVLEHTSVVIHCAATVRFNEPLRKAIDLNVKGVDRMIKLCRRMPKMECFLHCSTCYVNVDKTGDIEEKLYDAAADPCKLMEASNWMSEELLEGMSDNIKKRYHNTYTFTKHIAEELVSRECTDVPAVIFRPSAIAGIWKDGIPGWMDAFQGMTANAVRFGTGMVPRMPRNPALLGDVVPVDAVSNMIIACAAYRLHLTAKKDRSLPVFHCSSSSVNPLTAGNYRDLVASFLTKYPLEKIMLSPSLGDRGSPEFEDVVFAFKQHVVGPVLDAVGGFSGKKPQWANAFTKAREAFNILIPINSKLYVFKAPGMIELLEMMQPADREIFDFDVRKVDWTDFISDVLFGMKHFLAKNDIFSDEKLDAARKQVKRIHVLEFAASLLVPYLVSVLLTRDLKSWKVALPLGFALYYYFTCDQFNRVPVGDINSYRERIRAKI
ncbi:hypothetical protein PENTCL1PPCAC_23687 [Pristionchus entomophagus]|uniref:Fatty acyl-CoA reductase n=1 Tax=Pristionchus entomophagus TaxID=358040 RepID=A0AAV5U4Z2_9BILA|nr:hypothetical protein PENTCL1PPCAC_23687 [Pristionchus entomophagus]